MAERFYGEPGFDVLQGPDVEITDLDYKQGVILEGEESALDALIGWRIVFHDTVTRRRGPISWRLSSLLYQNPFSTKSEHRVVPTLINHHRLKIIAPDQVDRIEEFACSATGKEGRTQLQNGEVIGYGISTKGEKDRHRACQTGRQGTSSVGGRGRRSELPLREASDSKELQIQRRDPNTTGLKYQSEEGDYAVSEVRGGRMVITGTLIIEFKGKRLGIYHNINTPVEFYPDRIRYVDLEIDVVQYPDGRVEVVDERESAKRFEQGYLSRKMRGKAIREASRLKKKLINLAQ
jgi:hypothetical protein